MSVDCSANDPLTRAGYLLISQVCMSHVETSMALGDTSRTQYASNARASLLSSMTGDDATIVSRELPM